MPRTRITRTLAALVGATLLAVMAPSAPVPAATTGAGGLTSGDSLFPHQGNTGYNARRYDVSLAYSPAGRSIRAVSTMRAVALKRLTSFGLDLQGLTVRHVWVNGRAAAFRRHGSKLVVRPRRALSSGRLFTAKVQYAGRPRSHTDPDGSTEGWIRTGDGAVALNEPVGAMTWFPNNNTLRDKAVYTFTVRAPKSLEVAANGRLVRRTTKHKVSTWRYVMNQPMASYLATIGIGQYRIHRGRTRDGIRLLSFSDTGLPTPRAALRQLPTILGWLEGIYGRYPFADAGLVLDRVGVGYALETQTRPTFDGSVPTGELVHELAHQWYGDSVTPADWGDIWLNEGFASYAEWLWTARTGPSTHQQLASALARHPAGDAFWKTPPTAFTDPADLFASPIYQRGAMTLQALRETVGDGVFFKILRTWASQGRNRNVSTAQLVHLCERLSGKHLGAFFDAWLEKPHRPAGW